MNNSTFSLTKWRLQQEQLEEGWQLWGEKAMMRQVFIRAWVQIRKNEAPRDLGFEDVSDDIDMSSDDDIQEFLELPETDEIVEFQGATLIWDAEQNRVQMVVLAGDDEETDIDKVAMTYERDRRKEMGLK